MLRFVVLEDIRIKDSLTFTGLQDLLSRWLSTDSANERCVKENLQACHENVRGSRDNL